MRHSPLSRRTSRPSLTSTHPTSILLASFVMIAHALLLAAAVAGEPAVSQPANAADLGPFSTETVVDPQEADTQWRAHCPTDGVVPCSNQASAPPATASPACPDPCIAHGNCQCPICGRTRPSGTVCPNPYQTPTQCLTSQTMDTTFFVDFLYLKPYGISLPYSTPVDGNVPPGTLGPTSVVRPNHGAGLRIGGHLALGQHSGLETVFWYYGADTTDSISEAPNRILNADFAHPSRPGVGTTADSRYDIDFRMLDLSYTRAGRFLGRTAMTYLIGLRYARLDQGTRSHFDFDVPDGGPTTIGSQVSFEGVGLRIGARGLRPLGERFSLYARAAGSVLAGKFGADFQQDLDSASTVYAGYADERMVPVIDAEFGVGWQDPTGCLRVRAGYYGGFWFNTITTPTFLDRVQTGNYTNMTDRFSFGGMMLRGELIF